MSSQRFLAGEAPRIPLAQCSDPRGCSCQYKHHADRRRGPRRSQDIGMASKFYDRSERRTNRHGRRMTDY